MLDNIAHEVETADDDPITFASGEPYALALLIRPRRLEVTEAGHVWYADYRRGAVGRFEPETGAFDEWALPGGSSSAPYGAALDANGRFWVVETGAEPNRMIGIDTNAEEIVSITPIPSGAGPVRHMHYFAPEGEVWFGTDFSTIGRAKVAGP